MDDFAQRHDFTKLGNARRFVSISGEDFRWVPDVSQCFKRTKTPIIISCISIR